jgi:arabinose-5-phosphate isomerase
VNDVFQQGVDALMTHEPSRITAGELASFAITMMEGRERKILVLPVVDEQDKPVGMIHLHDLIG